MGSQFIMGGISGILALGNPIGAILTTGLSLNNYQRGEDRNPNNDSPFLGFDGLKDIGIGFPFSFVDGINEIAGKYLLTKVDSAINKEFTCNAPIKFTGGLLALAGGLLLGLAMAIPVVGWIAIGIVAVVAIGIAAVVATHSCNSGLEGNEWVDFHRTVKYDKQNAILYFHSTLVCSKGGILIASETFEQANTLSNNMSLNIWGENAVHFGSQFAIGFLAGKFGGSSAAGLAINVTLTVGLYILGETALKDNTPFSTVLGGLKVYFVDRTISMIEDSIKNIPTGQMLKNVGKGALAGAGGMAIDYLATKAEEALEEGRFSMINEHKNNESGKNIIAKKH